MAAKIEPVEKKFTHDAAVTTARGSTYLTSVPFGEIRDIPDHPHQRDTAHRAVAAHRNHLKTDDKAQRVFSVVRVRSHATAPDKGWFMLDGHTRRHLITTGQLTEPGVIDVEVYDVQTPEESLALYKTYDNSSAAKTSVDNLTSSIRSIVGESFFIQPATTRTFMNRLRTAMALAHQLDLDSTLPGKREATYVLQGTAKNISGRRFLFTSEESRERIAEGYAPVLDRLVRVKGDEVWKSSRLKAAAMAVALHLMAQGTWDASTAVAFIDETVNVTSTDAQGTFSYDIHALHARWTTAKEYSARYSGLVKGYLRICKRYGWI